MYKNKSIGVVVPAYNEEKFIAQVINTIPDYVDKIYVANDCSTDKTAEIASELAKQNNRVILINCQSNGGVGAAILTGHKQALKDNMDIIAVMAGDGQMDPTLLYSFLDPVAEGKTDYAKGNRLSNRRHKKEMPTWRSFGNFLLTNLTRIASGYWKMSDPQNGYTAISSEVLKKIDLNKIEKSFAFENDMLVKLNVVGARVTDIPHAAIYRGQRSKIRYFKFTVRTSWILLRDFIWRIWVEYIIKNRHPIRRNDTVEQHL
jgi:glycosyltransferase involved in cell wall biosynthesis